MQVRLLLWGGGNGRRQRSPKQRLLHGRPCLLRAVPWRRLCLLLLRWLCPCLLLLLPLLLLLLLLRVDRWGCPCLLLLLRSSSAGRPLQPRAQRAEAALKQLRCVAVVAVQRLCAF